jgi:Na+-transporting methylmalonyl-CoA/oxaloacetate decarboxylase gamma subunit
MAVIFPIEKPAQKQVLGVAIAFSILSIIAVCLRLLSHHIAHKKLILSDYFIIAAGVSICPS